MTLLALPAQTATIGALAVALTLAACATAGGFVVPSADIRQAYESAFEDGRPVGGPARAIRYTDARCRMESATVAACRYRYKTLEGGPWVAASQRMARDATGRWTWVFD